MFYKYNIHKPHIHPLHDEKKRAIPGQHDKQNAKDPTFIQPKGHLNTHTPTKKKKKKTQAEEHLILKSLFLFSALCLPSKLGKKNINK